MMWIGIPIYTIRVVCKTEAKSVSSNVMRPCYGHNYKLGRTAAVICIFKLVASFCCSNKTKTRPTILHNTLY